MAQDSRKMEYRTQGSAAYDPSFYVGEESTARQAPAPKPAPKPRPRRKTQPVTRQKMAVSPFALLGIAASLMMLVLVLFGYAQVYESASQVGEMRDTVTELQEENRKLQNEYDSSINLEKIEARAKELGMQQPTSKQSVTLRIPAEDTAVIAPQVASNPLRAAWEAIVETFQGLLEYLH